MTADRHLQLDLFDNGLKEKYEKMEFAIDSLRRRFGHNIIGRAGLLVDRDLSGFNPKDEHIIHPTSFFR